MDVGVGDLVHHVLMDDAWLGVVVRIEEQNKEGSTSGRHKVVKALIHIESDHRIPDFRSPRNKNLGRKIGWVDLAWLKVKNKAQ